MVEKIEAWNYSFSCGLTWLIAFLFLECIEFYFCFIIMFSYLEYQCSVPQKKFE